MIEIRQVGHAFGERTVLRDLTLDLSERRIAVVGANGSGKSTFARLLNGLLVPNSGTVRVDGLDTRRDGKAVRRKVGFVFQNPDNQIVLPVVAEDLAFGLKNLGLPKDEIGRRVDEALDRYDLRPLRDHPAHLLSGGQKQLLAIAGVLAMAPEAIVFDEPTTLLDLRNKRRIAQAIDALPQRAIVVSHDLAFLEHFDRVLVFEDGRVAIDDRPAVALPAYVAMMS
ncbi:MULTISPECIES: ATP-binding cassette domain-containing protein [Methylobacterium]|uniref:energy-coupling factor ABC transporter ATP-binding protein n=1 Tax=Methylobacterium TaxID=407 RepID=UPI0008F3227D|nr:MULTISPECIES: ATP-binding cassette domain-containing protein [Methylobacterium]MBK3398578.1 ATP-binding cassette domain-containing protein [Methylobacterium ajmalii]MBK3412770.1 ATP-binding cassette domain-containing protein [Methylobacterium ajmalii]MBK3425892.1 ATP-binding cassette domain-containing protein [Methylobacterium ajmalii]MBZ6413168.1 ATP-binding cassette domain-containing protein [Methylobacterium sp.]SFF43749.1 biotin transport system ATP-binding protein [Methylobacterium sp.